MHSGHPMLYDGGLVLVPATPTHTLPTVSQIAGIPHFTSPYHSVTTAASVPTIINTHQHSHKRGSEDLLAHSVVSNGSGMSPIESGMDMMNDAKKAKLDSPKASRVIHFRGVPADATESEIVQLGLPFGRMTNLVLARKKNQALLEMADISCSTTMVDYYMERPPQIRGQMVYVQYSNHEELKTESPNAHTGAQAALQAASQMASSDEAKLVLRVIVEHMLYPVTIEVLKQIFSRYGQVLRLVTFNKNSTFQALIEYSDSVAAQTAKASLNGQNIYNNCCTLRIDFSKLTSLNVKYNNEKSRDYTNPNLPAGDIGSLDGAVVPAGIPGLGIPQLANPTQQPPGGGITMMSPFSSAVHAGLGSPMFTAAQQAAAINAGATGGMPFGLLQTAQGLGMGLRLPGNMALQTGPVLMVSNLNEEMVTPDGLFTLFGVYGDVQRVKIMFNKKDNALVQFADASQANTAMIYLDKVTLWSKMIKVTPSKHSVVQLPKEGQPDAGLTKDYTMSPLHRFKKPNSKNHNNIFAPSSTLHLSNIPPNVTEETLSEAFAKHGTVMAFKFFQKDRKMALIQMGSCEEAVHGLIAMHNYQLAEAAHLRVSFSKATITKAT